MFLFIARIDGNSILGDSEYRSLYVVVGVVIVVSMGVVFGLLIGASMLGVAVCLLRW